MSDLRDQTYKQELVDPEPSKHPDERMQMTIKNPTLRIPAKMMIDTVTGKLVKWSPKLSKSGPG